MAIKRALFLKEIAKYLGGDLDDLKKNYKTKETLLAFFASFTIEKIIKEVEKARPFWVASAAENPDPAHINYYGEFLDTLPERPGERYGCQCGIGYN